LEEDLRVHGAGMKDANGPAAALRGVHGMGTEEAEGVGVTGGQEGVNASAEVLANHALGSGRG